MAIKNKELPVLKIGKHQPKYPIIQGGMGIMVSGPKLAAAVAAEGGIGTIASVGLAASSDGLRPLASARRKSAKTIRRSSQNT